jgi:hypothetical protein
MARRAALALLLAVSPASAAPDVDSAVWAGGFATRDLGEGDGRLWFDVHARHGSAGFVGIVRPGLGLRLTDGSSAWVGGAWIVGVPDDGGPTHELRLWQQGLATARAARASWVGRLRFEQRWRDVDEVGLRLRLFARAGAADPAGRPSFVAWDEVFVGLNATRWGAVGGLDQNRLFLGASVPLDGGGRVEVGGLSVVMPRDGLRFTWGVAVNAFAGRRARER